MAKEVLKKIPVELLPDGYRENAGKKFGLAERTIHAIATGFRKNDEVFSYLLDLATEEKSRRDAINCAHLEKLNALTN